MPGIKTAAAPVTLTIVTKMPSPYQVELLDEIARVGEFDISVVYLNQSASDREWEMPVPRHRHVVLGSGDGTWSGAWQMVDSASLVVFAYYTHPFALVSLHYRAGTGRPWVFWGERPGFHHLGPVGRFFRWALLRPLRVSDAPVWGIGHFAVEGYRAEFGDSRCYTNLPYFSDLACHLSIQRETSDRPVGRRFLFSGALVRRKGVFNLAQAFLRLAAEDTSVTLTVMGSGPLRAALESILEPVSDRVEWLGFVEWSNLANAYSKGDILCVPSRYDGWGMVVVEGMAAAMPVIASSEMGAAKELLEDCATGWIVPPDDEDALLEAMRAAASLHLPVLEKMGAAGRQRAQFYDATHGAARFAVAAHKALEHSGVYSRSIAQSRRKLRVMLVVNYLHDGQHSMQRYGTLLEDGLREKGVEVIVVRPPQRMGHLASSSSTPGRWLGYVDKFGLFPAELRARCLHFTSAGDSIVHIIDQGNGVYLPFVADMPHLITCHDLISVKAGTGCSAHWKEAGRFSSPSSFQKYNKKALQNARRIACISEATRDDCVQTLGIDSKACKVIYNPLDPFFQESSGSRSSRLPERFLLHVGGSSWYKNREGLMRIYRAMRDQGYRSPLVIMGSRLRDTEQQTAVELGILDHMVLVEHCSDAEVRNAYAHADALVFPSFEEGFGWPILEALAQETPVFTSNIRPMTEVGGGVARYIDISRPDSAASQIMQALASLTGDAMLDWKQSARRHALSFSVDRFASEYLDYYQQILGEMSQGPSADLFVSQHA